MRKLELSEEENQVLVEVLEGAVSDLGTEIAGTESASYRKGLKSKKQSVMAILERLRTEDS
jgi:hypothetical protein